MKHIYDKDANQVLKCFHCGEQDTHVQGIAWFRRGEDSEFCETLIADSKSASVEKTGNKNNPSARRDGMHIIYNCEHCDEFSSLAIAQHKGNTFIASIDCPKEFLSTSFDVGNFKFGA